MSVDDGAYQARSTVVLPFANDIPDAAAAGAAGAGGRAKTEEMVPRKLATPSPSRT